MIVTIPLFGHDGVGVGLVGGAEVGGLESEAE